MLRHTFHRLRRHQLVLSVSFLFFLKKKKKERNSLWQTAFFWQASFLMFDLIKRNDISVYVNSRYLCRAFRAESDIFTYLFPKFIYPFTHIAMTGTIFMTVAITVERYLGLCHPLLSPHSRKVWFYLLPVIVVAFALNVPKFLEIELGNINVTNAVTGQNETKPSYGPSDLRMSMTYIKAYIMWTRLFSTGLIPVVLLLCLNLRIIMDILSSSKKTQRYEGNNWFFKFPWYFIFNFFPDLVLPEGNAKKSI